MKEIRLRIVVPVAIVIAFVAVVLVPSCGRLLIPAARPRRIWPKLKAQPSFTAALEQANRTGAVWYPAQLAEARRALEKH